MIKKTAKLAGVKMATVYDIIKEEKTKNEATPCRKHKKNSTPKIKDQTKIDIAKVYHYLEQEYEELKQRYLGLDLTSLTKFSRRTALATGVSETVVLRIVQEEEAQNTEMPQEHFQKQSLFCNKSKQTDMYVKPDNDYTRIDIAKVYNYFEQEYEELKKTYVGLDLNPLWKFQQRTALATGVSQSTVMEILQKEGRLSAGMRQEQLRKQSLAGVKDEPLETSEIEMLVVKGERLEAYEEDLEFVKNEPGVSGANFFNSVERVEALDMSEEEADELLEEATVDEPEDEVRPSTSGLKTLPRSAPRREVVDGSDLDSEFDDEFDVDAMLGAARKDIPDTEELDEPMQKILNAIDTGMDDAADRLLGTSPSFTWLSDFESFRGVREKFSGPTPGSLKDYDSPYDAFIDIWDEDIVDLIVRETNRYAQQTIEAKRNSGTLTRLSRLHSWTDTNADEIMLLFAVFMYMALDPRTSIAEYWTKDEVLQLTGFRRLMTYNRYILLSKFLHFVDNTADASQQNGDASSARLSAKLVKLSPIIEHLGKKFKSLYNLGPDVSIDESLTLFKGRLSWVQTIRSRSARYGIKSYELCESGTGYMAGFRIYTGKFAESCGDNSLCVDLGAKSTEVVLELLQGLEHRGHCVVMDNFYNCPSLARYLKSLGFDCLGTLRTCRRNVPSDIAEVPMNVSKGTIISRHCGDVSITAWMDSKMVNIISTYHRADTYIGSKAGKSLLKPVCVRDYNTSMGGVDLKDQKLSMYLLERKRGVKLYVKMFKKMLNMSIHNALVMYLSSLKRRDKLPVTHREFLYQLAEALYKRHRPCPVQELSRPVNDLMRLRRDILHEPEYNKGRNARKRCMICLRKKETKLVHTKCTQCEAYLCFGDCWRIWHSAAELPGEKICRRKRRRADE